ncbi:MAG: hypothetical protein AB1555_19950, partial [Nitrospirota bacterium]
MTAARPPSTRTTRLAHRGARSRSSHATPARRRGQACDIAALPLPTSLARIRARPRSPRNAVHDHAETPSAIKLKQPSAIAEIR